MATIPDILPANDRQLIKAVVAGEVWPANAVRPTPEQLANPEFVKNMPVIQASTIRALCLGLWDGVTIDPLGVRIRGVRIEGVLDLSFGKADVPLDLKCCHIEQRPNLRHAQLPALYLNGCRLECGLDGDGLRLRGNLFFRSGFTSIGEIRLLNAHIEGNINFDQAIIYSKDGPAFNADGLKLDASMFCQDNFSAKGEFRLLGARIRGNIEFNSAILDGGEDPAFNADGLILDGDLFCRDDFSIAGEVVLVGASIKGLFDWRPNQWHGKLDLSHARAGSWRDCWQSVFWSKAKGEPRIALDDFQYGSFFADKEIDVRATSRIAWIETAQGTDFKPGPYEVLARVLRAAGDYDGAVQVGLAKERAWTKHRLNGSVGLDKALIRLRTGFLDHAIGHGYRPWYGARLLAVWLLAGTIFFGLGAPKGYTALWVYDGPGVIKPAEPMAIIDNLNNKPGERATMQDPHTATDPDGALQRVAERVLNRGHGFTHVLPAEYTPFSPFWYSLDTLIPLVDLGQERAWSPSPIGSFWQDLKGWGLLLYLYIHIIMGWVLTTLTVVALTGLIKRDKEKE